MAKIAYNEELERMIIGNVLINKHLSIAEKQISTVDFFVDTHKWMWSSIVELDEEGQPIEVMDVHGKTFEKFSDFILRVSDVTNYSFGASGTTRIKDVKTLKDLATLRFLHKKFEELAELSSINGNVLDIIEEAENLVNQVKQENRNENGNAKLLIEVIENEIFPKLDQFVKNDLVKIPFGFELLDNATNGGASLGDLVIIGAKPKQGKSALGVQIMRIQAELGFTTDVVSREMLNHENGYRIMAQTTSYDMNIFRPNLNPIAADRLKEQSLRLAPLKMYLDDRSRNLKQLRKEAKRLKDEQDLNSMLVDYVQLMLDDGRKDSKANQIEDLVYGLKDLAMELGIIIYAPAQFSYEGIKTDRPRMWHFEGSSAISKAANIVLIHQLEDERRATDGTRGGKMWIEAGRNIGTDEFNIRFFGSEARFIFE